MENQNHFQSTSIGDYDPGLIESLAQDMTSMTNHYSTSDGVFTNGTEIIVTDLVDSVIADGNGL